ncbi:hypothetical protein FRC03_008259 [Tulasnella sp. 419]|nr:hypothetical protein FRC03_008259 [Tulasnella sp. 419]
MEKADSVRNMEHPSPPCSGETPLSTINDGTSNDATQEITPTTPNHIQIPISTNPVDEDHTPTSSPTAVSDDNRNSNGPHVTPNTFKIQKLDIEHAFVANDPRQWKAWRKNLNLLIISVAAVAPTLGANIYNPAFNQIKSQLRATDHEIAMSLSLFILVQGVAPLVWSSTSEIVGRKFVYIVALSVSYE